MTKKGQATIPKELREKHKITRKALAVDTKDGVLLRPLPEPLMEKGSLKELFSGRTSSQLIEEARSKKVESSRAVKRRRQAKP